MGVVSSLFKSSLRKKGKSFTSVSKDGPKITVEIYRYSSESGGEPSLDSYELDASSCGSMVLDAMLRIKAELDPSISFRRSCREGVCGSCAMNINGKNTLACTAKLSDYGDTVSIFPLPHLPVVRDLVTDMTTFYKQYASIKPWLQRDVGESAGARAETLQSPEERDKLDGLYECILCACCSTSCPSYWWNGSSQGGYLGPAVLLQMDRWVTDSRDCATDERLSMVADNFKVSKCYTIMNCVDSCPKGLNPAQSIANIKRKVAAKKILG